MRLRTVLILLFIFLPIMVHAGKKEDLAEEMMRLTEADKMVDQIRVQVELVQKQMMDQVSIPEGRTKEANEFQDGLNGLIFRELTWEKMKDDCIKAITEVYSEEELSAMVDFYRSPVGQGIVRKQPLLMQKLMAISQERMRALIPEMERMIKEFKGSIQG